MARPRVKICGVTRVEDAELAASLGADLLGLNFWSGSPRSVAAGRAARIAAAVAGRTRLVGVFVNQERAEIEDLAARVGLDLVQLHGDESPEEVAAFGARAIKALRPSAPLGGELLAPYAHVWGFLIEARQANRYGGTGVSWAYETVAALPRTRPLLLAGGLAPANVRRAAAVSGAWGVDVCSGVEAAPGVKDPAKMRRFFEELERGGD